MKIILEFDDDEEHEAAARHIHCSDAFCMLWDIDQAIRSRLKYKEGVTEEETRFLEELRGNMSSLLELWN